MKTHIDGSVYPDTIPPSEFFTLEQKADYMHRVISAFDFGIPPEAATLRLFSEWQDIFDRFPLPASAGYHALRTYFNWPEVKRETFLTEPAYLKLDAFEGRVDGCEDHV